MYGGIRRDHPNGRVAGDFIIGKLFIDHQSRNTILIGMEIIITELISNPEHDEQKYRQADGQAGYIDETEKLVMLQVSECYY